MLNQFIDEVKGEIEAWSQRGSGWVMDEILEAFINVVQYQPLRGGSHNYGVANKAEKQKGDSQHTKQR